MQIEETQCCGVDELGNLGDHDSAQEAMEALCTRLEDRFSLEEDPCAIYLFTGVIEDTYGDEPTYGQDFAEFIKENKLGKVVETKPVINPNTDNTIVAWLWTVDWIALKKWHDNR